MNFLLMWGQNKQQSVQTVCELKRDFITTLSTLFGCVALMHVVLSVCEMFLIDVLWSHLSLTVYFISS